MSLIKSISGIRGTIGGQIGDNLTPVDIVNFVSAYAEWLRANQTSRKVVVGRDGRISGPVVQTIVNSTLQSCGFDVLDAGLSTTPSIELAVGRESAAGGIMVSASHNGKEWNALKFLNHHGEFISKSAGAEILSLAASGRFNYCDVDALGKISNLPDTISAHIDDIFELPVVNVENIREKSFKIAVDCINSTGAISIVPLLERLKCNVLVINQTVNGEFAHDPEPLEHNLEDLRRLVVEESCDLGIAVDPDVDRLAIVSDDGSFFGEEYTIVAIADYLLANAPGKTVSNLSSTRALKDITEKHGGTYVASAVGEVNVVSKMKEVGAVFGGEGNGGVIYPPLHYGRDALVGIALILSHLSKTNLSSSALRSKYPNYHISKKKVTLHDGLDPDVVIQRMNQEYIDQEKVDLDGLKLIFGKEWVHLRKSNTEPIIRVYAESTNESRAESLADRFVNEVQSLTTT